MFLFRDDFQNWQYLHLLLREERTIFLQSKSTAETGHDPDTETDNPDERVPEDEDGSGGESSVLDFSGEKHQQKLSDEILAVSDKFALTNREGMTGLITAANRTERVRKLIQEKVAQQAELDINAVTSYAKQVEGGILGVTEKQAMEYARLKQHLKVLGTLKSELSARRDERLRKRDSLRTPRERGGLGKIIEWTARGRERARDARDTLRAWDSAKSEDQEKLGFAYDRQFRRALKSVDTLNDRTKQKIIVWEKRFEKQTKRDKPVKESLARALGVNGHDFERELEVHFSALDDRGNPARGNEKREWREVAKRGEIMTYRDELAKKIRDNDGFLSDEERDEAKARLKRLEGSLEFRMGQALQGDPVSIARAFSRLRSISRTERNRLKALHVISERDISRELSGEASRVDALREALTSKPRSLPERRHYHLDWRQDPLIANWTEQIKRVFDGRNTFFLEKVDRPTRDGKEVPTKIYLRHGPTDKDRDATVVIDLDRGTIVMTRWISRETQNGRVVETAHSKKEFNAQTGPQGKRKIREESSSPLSIRILDGIKAS